MKLRRFTLRYGVALLLAAATLSLAQEPLKTNVKNPRAIAVVIGISDYDSMDVPKVDFAINDAQSVQRVLIDTLGYSDANVLLRTNKDASIGRMKQLVRRQLQNLVVPGQSDVFFYYSGHGAPNANTKEAYLIPWDFQFGDEPNNESAYSIKDLYADLASLKAKSVTVILESCFSGANDSGKTLTRDASPLGIVSDNPSAILTAANGVVITASGGQEVATWYRDQKHGLLTYYWLQAMRGEGEDAQGRLTVSGLKQYLDDKVPFDARRLRGRTQTPTVMALDSNHVLATLPISAVRTGAATVGVAFGSLNVIAIEGGDLYVDGVRQETLPAGGTFTQRQIQVGSHSIEMRKDGYNTVTRRVTIQPDKPSSETIQLAAILPDTPQIQKFYGQMVVTIEQGGTLYIDNVKQPDLPAFGLFTSGKLEAGTHQVRVERSGFTTLNETVTVRPNETLSMNRSLRAVAAAVPAVAAAANQPTAANNSIGMEFVKIQPGAFTMGCSAGDTRCDSDETPVHSVRITKSFELGKYEVTQAQWQEVTGNNPSLFKGTTRPVEIVSWNDVQNFLAGMNAKRDGYRYRLPTEAEWEYAARAGTTGPYPGVLDAIGWYSDNSGTKTHPVGQKQANAWGLYDMIGNVWEWVQDWHGNYSSSAATDPTGPSMGTRRVLRGGSWGGGSGSARVSDRVTDDPSERVSSFGFRVAREVIP